MTPLPDHLLESLAAEAINEGLADALFTTVSTPIGRLVVVQGARGVVRVGFDDERDDHLLAEVAGVLGPRILRSRRELAATGEAIEVYLEGDSTELDLPVDFALVRSDFRRRVLEILHDDVPRGGTVSYGTLAARAGNPKAARAAGTACATNPIPLIVPCHRVVRTDGYIGQYSLGGPENKRTILAVEGADPDGLEALARSGIRYVGSDTTRIYCMPTCHDARRVTERHLVRFHSAREADAAGYRPCLHCRPVAAVGAA